MNIFTAVKEAVSPLDAAKFYGMKINRNGMCLCPFHNDRHPSLKIDKDVGGGFYCFGCQEHGNVIGLVGKLFGIDDRAAAEKIAADFQIKYDGSENVMNYPLPPEEIERRKRINEQKVFAIKRRELCGLILKTLSEMREKKWQCEEKAMKVLEDNELYCWIIHRLDSLENSYDFLNFEPEDDVKEAIDQIDEEVRNSVREFEEICRRSKAAS